MGGKSPCMFATHLSNPNWIPSFDRIFFPFADKIVFFNLHCWAWLKWNYVCNKIFDWFSRVRALFFFSKGNIFNAFEILFIEWHFNICKCCFFGRTRFFFVHDKKCDSSYVCSNSYISSIFIAILLFAHSGQSNANRIVYLQWINCAVYCF